MGIDSKDSQKIEERTQPNVGRYDYRLDLEGDGVDGFSFLVLGDSGHIDETVNAIHNVANRIADEPDVDFILHLGDVVYVDGSKENYPDRFIEPYRYWLADREDLHYNNMVFVMTSGDEAGEVRRISDYAGADGSVTLDTALSGTPSTTETFAILATSVASAGALTTKQDSDLTQVNSDVILILSSVSNILSDTVVIESQTTVMESDSIIIESNTVVL